MSDNVTMMPASVRAGCRVRRGVRRMWSLLRGVAETFGWFTLIAMGWTFMS